MHGWHRACICEIRISFEDKRPESTVSVWLADSRRKGFSFWHGSADSRAPTTQLLLPKTCLVKGLFIIPFGYLPIHINLSECPNPSAVFTRKLQRIPKTEWLWNIIRYLPGFASFCLKHICQLWDKREMKLKKKNKNKNKLKIKRCWVQHILTFSSKNGQAIKVLRKLKRNYIKNRCINKTLSYLNNDTIKTMCIVYLVLISNFLFY